MPGGYYNLPAGQYERLRQTLWDDEGEELDVYKDSKGRNTVGYGHLVLPGDNLKVGDSITKERAEALYKQDVTGAIHDARSFVPNIWNDLSPERQNVLINMAYNLGATKLGKFKEMRKGLRSGDYAYASDQMLNNYDDKTGKWTGHTPWSNQTGRRSKRLSNRMENNIWGSDIPWYINAGYFVEDQYDWLKKQARGLIN